MVLPLEKSYDRSGDFMKNMPVFRRFLVAVLAIIALAAGAYVMPQVNPFFASRPTLSRSEARAIADNYLKQQGYDLSGFYVDAFFAYDVSGLHYLMSVFGVTPVIERSRAEQLQLSW
jgi:hypothetical protein